MTKEPRNEDKRMANFFKSFSNLHHPSNMANPFYARYVPPSITIERKDPDVNSNPHPDLDHIQLIKKRKTRSGFKPIVRSGEEKTIEFDDSVPETNQVQIQEAGYGRKKKRRTAHDGESDSLVPSNSSESVPDTQDPPQESDLEGKRVEIEVYDIGKEEKKSNGKREKKKIKQSSTTESGANGNFPSQISSIPEEAKHKKIRTRYEKAAKVSIQNKENVDVFKIDGLEEHEDEPASPIEIHGLVPLPQPPQSSDTDDKPTFSALPDWLAHPTFISSSATTSLDNLKLSPGVLAALKQKGYQDAFAIQTVLLPLLLPGTLQYPGDICISAATGSGKTLAYTLPMVENLRDKPTIRLRGLVVVPTRELVAQVQESLEVCGAGSGLKIGTAVGSKSLKMEQELLMEKGQKYDPGAYRREKEKLSAEENELMNWDVEDSLGTRDDFECLENYVVDYSSKVDILICTPGRLVDHIQSTKGFTLDHVQWLVIDEADRLLDESFQQWVEIVMPALEYQAPLDPINQQLLDTLHLLSKRKVRKIILSATMTRDISKITALRLRQPMMAVLETTRKAEDDNSSGPNKIHLDSKHSIELPPALKEFAVPISNVDDKPLHLIEILRQEPGCFPSTDQTGKKVKSRTPPESRETSPSDSDGTSDHSSSESLKSSSSFNDYSKASTSNPQLLTPPSFAPTYGTLVFTKNNENATRLARLLALLHPAWHAQIGTLTKSTSTASGRRTLAQFRSRKLAILIASDRASRGLDIPHLAHVINYDLPTSVTAYVHRVGRTARAGRQGRATTLVVKHEAHWFWNEIARGAGGIARAAEKKVVRVESRLEGWGKGERRAYADALKRLGEEAKAG